MRKTIYINSFSTFNHPYFHLFILISSKEIFIINIKTDSNILLSPNFQNFSLIEEIIKKISFQFNHLTV